MPYVVNAPRVGHQTIDGEVILIDFSTGAYFSIDAVGAEAWTLLGRGLSPTEIATLVSVRYDVPMGEAKADLDRFLDELLAESLIRSESAVAEKSTDPAVPGDWSVPTCPYEPPSLSKFTDIEALLQLDPIHDVDEQGWPVQNVPRS